MFIVIYNNNITLDIESNRPVCDDAISGLGGSGLVVVRCLQNMVLSIMTNLYNG
jgi:hypothetical protein